MGLGLVALAARPVGYPAVAVVALVGVAAVLVPVPRGEEGLSSRSRVLVVAVGLVPFAVARTLWPLAPAPLPVAGIAAAVVAAVAEEAFFRRLVYGWLLRWGAVAAILGAAAAFALVHVPGYGWPAAAVNLGAGVVLGWQRWATGGWGAPAATHAAANLLSVA